MTSTKRRIDRQSKDGTERHDSGLVSRDWRYQDVRFEESGGSKAMNVNGSGAAVDFFIGPPPGELWVIEYASLLLIDPGTMAAAVFGSLVGALTNGLKMIEKINGVEKVYAEAKDNADLALSFFGGQLTPASSAVGDGFLNNIDKVSGRISFSGNVILDGDDSDQLILRVNDDLLLIETLNAAAHTRVER